MGMDMFNVPLQTFEVGGKCQAPNEEHLTAACRVRTHLLDTRIRRQKDCLLRVFRVHLDMMCPLPIGYKPQQITLGSDPRRKPVKLEGFSTIKATLTPAISAFAQLSEIS